MSGAIGHRVRPVMASMFPARPAGGAPFWVSSALRRRGAVPARPTLRRVATLDMDSASGAESPWSLLPQPAYVRLAHSSVVKIADGARIAVRGDILSPIHSTADRFM